MKKQYKARTSISINVVLGNKSSMHVPFITQSDGSSVYATDNEEVQRALERHYRFGTLFKAVEVEETPVAAVDDETSETEGEEQPSVRKVSVSDYSSAKDYLADTFGLSRTSLRSQKSIIEAAAAHGIEFEGLG